MKDVQCYELFGGIAPKDHLILIFHCCNQLLFGQAHDVTSHMQWIQNYAARVTLRLLRSSNITIYLKSLYWLPVKVYHCYSSTAPSNDTDMPQKKS